jgi:hypothetical protein
MSVFRTEVDFRARLIALESGHFARAARRSVITGADVELARRSFVAPADAGASRGGWSALPGSLAARLAVSDGVLRGAAGAGATAALAAVGGGAGGAAAAAAGAAVAGDGREAAGALAAVFSSLSDDADATPAGAAVSALTRLAPNTVARALPVMVGALRGVFEAAMVGDDAERDGARVLRALALLDALVADARVPLESFGAEFLALSASAALAGGGAGGAALAPPPRLRARARAAAVFARVVARVRGAAPDTHAQAVGLCLDAAAGAALSADGDGRPARVTLAAADTLFAATSALVALAPADPAQKALARALATRLEAHWVEGGAPPLNTWAHAAKGALERLKAM